MDGANAAPRFSREKSSIFTGAARRAGSTSRPAGPWTSDRREGDWVADTRHN
jgi:hypothetical protein